MYSTQPVGSIAAWHGVHCVRRWPKRQVKRLYVAERIEPPGVAPLRILVVASIAVGAFTYLGTETNDNVTAACTALGSATC